MPGQLLEAGKSKDGKGEGGKEEDVEEPATSGRRKHARTRRPKPKMLDTLDRL